jgi:hypothetical protein
MEIAGDRSLRHLGRLEIGVVVLSGRGPARTPVPAILLALLYRLEGHLKIREHIRSMKYQSHRE